MILVIGGVGAGKLPYIHSLGYKDSDIAVSELNDKPVLYRLEEMINKDGYDRDAYLEALSKKDIISVAEVGSGVIPAEYDERRWREEVGRISCRLADRADSVIRLVAGIPVKIK
ncbi:MAG: bifunctional adenosylcobinamide kinase/adenosylcobinamide-phosphate guanylyltransferase [Oscillospiraceae bacterium]|nr:bifunctional adenosylcobinamide kinase/adenosylcobinamide-phosphate guanylyltransferase [Oscillospiraceae bacterium]